MNTSQPKHINNPPHTSVLYTLRIFNVKRHYYSLHIIISLHSTLKVRPAISLYAIKTQLEPPHDVPLISLYSQVVIERPSLRPGTAANTKDAEENVVLLYVAQLAALAVLLTAM